MTATSTTFDLPNLLHSPRSTTFFGRFSWLKGLKWADWLSVGLTVLGGGAVLGGVLALMLTPRLPIAAQVDQSAGGIPDLGTVTVSVTGAVAQPGLISLQEGDRVAQAIAQAGGFLPEADSEQLTSLNLAAKVTDGQQIAIRFQSPKESQSPTATVATSSNSSLININTAAQKDLETLPGIGAVRAQSIIENRPYQSLAELVTKDVITQKLLSDIESLISL